MKPAYSEAMNTPLLYPTSVNVRTVSALTSSRSSRPTPTASRAVHPESVWACPADSLFASFASSGGAWTCDVAAELLRGTMGQPISKLARWIVDGDLIRFQRRSRWFLPTFQFSHPEMTPLPCVGRVVGELRGVFDEREIVSWFANPNSWLNGARPAELAARRPQCVIQAARADRFIATGD
jgi:hypothetical protein